MLRYLALGVFGAFGVAVGAMLIAPWRIDLYFGKTAESTQVSVRAHLRWLFLGWRMDGGRARARRASRPAAATAARSGRRGGFSALRAALATPGLVARVWRLVIAIGRQAWPRDVAVRGRVGFDDPADTGMFIGTCCGIACAVPHRRWRVRIEPDFTGPIVEGEAHVGWSLRLISLLGPVMAFIASPVVWRGIGSAMRARRL